MRKAKLIDEYIKDKGNKIVIKEYISKYRYNNNKNIYIKTKGKRASKVLREY